MVSVRDPTLFWKSDLSRLITSAIHSLSGLIIIIIIIHEFHRDASVETKLQGRYVSRITHVTLRQGIKYCSNAVTHNAAACTAVGPGRSNTWEL